MTAIDRTRQATTTTHGAATSSTPMARQTPTYSPSREQDRAHDDMLRNLASALAPKTTRETSRDLEIQMHLDDARIAASGPYMVGGVAVAASPQFRMMTGFNQTQSDFHRTTSNADQNIFAVLKRARLDPSYAVVCSGRGTPTELVKVTQALIDQGYLPREGGSVSERIRAMQWEWGIGMDCAGFVQQSLLGLPGASRQSLGLKRVDIEDFSAIASNKAFTRSAPEAARPGDIVALDSPPPDVGHRAIVHANRAIDPVRADALKKQMGAACVKFLGGAGPFCEITVDSCWGAGPNGSWAGGVRQETWLYDASSKTWACWRPASPEQPNTWKLDVGPDPCGEKLIGIFRPNLA